MQSSLEQPDTLVYADIGLASLKKSKHVVTLSPDTLDDRVEYALLNHCDSVQKPVVETDHCSVVGKINIVMYIARLIKVRLNTNINTYR